MKTFRYILGSLLTAGLALAAAAPQKGGEDETGPYEVVPNWPQPFHEEGWTWGSTAAVWAESPDRVLVFQRGELDVLAKAIYTWPKFLTAASRSCGPRQAPSAPGSLRRRHIA